MSDYDPVQLRRRQLRALGEIVTNLQRLRGQCIRWSWYEHRRQLRLAQHTLPSWPVTDGTTLGDGEG